MKSARQTTTATDWCQHNHAAPAAGGHSGFDRAGPSEDAVHMSVGAHDGSPGWGLGDTAGRVDRSAAAGRIPVSARRMAAHCTRVDEGTGGIAGVVDDDAAAAAVVVAGRTLAEEDNLAAAGRSHRVAAHHRSNL